MMTKLEVLKDAKRLISEEVETYVCNAIQYGLNEDGERFHRVREGERFNHEGVDLEFEKQVRDLVDRVSYLIRRTSTMTAFVIRHVNGTLQGRPPVWYSKEALEKAMEAYVVFADSSDTRAEEAFGDLASALRVLRLELLDYMIKEYS